MSTESETLVEHLTQSLSGNPEAQLATRQLLTERFAAVNPEIIERELAKIQGPSQKKQTRFLRKHRVPLFLSLNLLLLLGIALPIFLKAQSTAPVLEELDLIVYRNDVGELASFKSQLNKNEQVFVFGDPDIDGDNRFSTHYRNNPQDPTALALHLLTSGSPKPELFDLGKQLEPENSFYPLLEAAHSLEASTIRNKAYRGRRSAVTIPRRIISDPERFNEAIAQLKKATKTQQYQNHGHTNLTRQLAILPPETDLHSRRARQFVETHQPGDYSLVRFDDAIKILVEDHLKKQEFQSLRDLFDLSISLPVHYSQHPSDIILFLNNRRIWPSLSKTFSQPEIQKHLTNIQQKQLQVITQEVAFHEECLTAHREKCYSLSSSEHQDPSLQGAGPCSGSSIGYVSPYLSLVSPPAAEELIPERLYWQAALERVAAFAMALLFLILSLILFVPFRKKKALHQVGSHFDRSTPTASLLSFSLLITAIAFASHLVITRLTPLGGLETSWLTTYYLFPQAPHLLILTCLILVFAFTLARHLVRKRLAPLHLATPLKRISWWPIFLVLLVYPLTALHKFYEDPPTVGWEVCAEYLERIPLLLLAIFSFWLLWLLFRSLTGDRTNRLSRKLITRYTAYLLVVPTLAAILANPLLRFQEIKWFKRDHFLSTNEFHYGLSRFENDVTLALFQRQDALIQKLTELKSQASDSDQ